MPSQIDLYTGIHKGQRDYLSKFSKQAGTLDINDPKALTKLSTDYEELIEHFKIHAALEEQHIHPLLYDRIPEGAKDLEQDHRRQEQILEDLGKHLKNLSEKPVDFEKRGEIALEFYRGFNRFISIYLAHINKEEEVIQPSLWKLCTSGELLNVFNTIIASMEPQMLMLNLSIMIPAMNIDERTILLKGIKASAPPEAYKGVTALAQRVLSPEEWDELKGHLV
jgi:iron-sulfur cluster repair protein YtfE (RIC family)